jgi:[acyl-carrier-protein] S-malonyltransferase
MGAFYLFPGQGSQRPGMGKDFFDAAPEARAVFEVAAAESPAGFLEIIFNGSQEDLNDTRVAQPALLTVEVAIAKALEARGIQPVGCAGHSLGEIPALVIAGAVQFVDALRFTRERARLMSENVPAGGMAAVMGLDADAIEAALPAGTQIANYNGESQTIISGAMDALAVAEAALKAAGAKRVLPLKVSGPFHSEFMRPAAEDFAKVLAGIDFEAPKCRFISSVSGGEVSDPEDIRALLARQLCSPVRWTQASQAIGQLPAWEIGPGAVLKGLAKRIPGGPDVNSLATMDEFLAISTT